MHVILESIVIMQYPMYKGINVFGDAGAAAVLEELQRLHQRVQLSHVTQINLLTKRR